MKKENIFHYGGVIDNLGGSFKKYFLENNMPQKINRLKKGLDSRSIEVIDKCLCRMLHYPDLSNSFLFFENQDGFIRYFQTLEEYVLVLTQNKKLKNYYDNFYLDEHCYNPDTFLFHNGLAFASTKIHEYIKGKDFIDGGAYIGDSALIYHTYYSPKKIYSFEISERTVKRYKSIMAFNCIPEDAYEIVPKGISDKVGVQYIDDDASQGTSICSSGTNMISTTTVDEFSGCQNLHCGFIKLDVEGVGLKALQGAKETIRRDRPVLSISIYHNPEEFFEIKPTFERIVENLNYKIEVLHCHPFVDALLEVSLFAYPAELEGTEGEFLKKSYFDCAANKWDSAAENVKKYLDIVSHNLLALQHYADICIEQKKLNDLLAISRVLQSKYPNLNIGWRYEASYYELKHDINSAITLIVYAIKIQPTKFVIQKLVDLLRLSGSLLTHHSYLESYINLLKEKFPNCGEGFIQSSYCFEKTGDLQAAVDTALKAISVEPTNLWFWMWLCELQRRQIGSASSEPNSVPMATAKEVCQRFPNCGEGFAQIAHCFSASGDFETAIMYAKKALDIEPLYAFQFRVLLCELLIHAKKAEEGEAVIFDGLDLNPDWTEGYLLLSRIYNDSGKKILFAYQALTSNPYNFYARENLINCLRHNSEFERAKKLIDEGLQIWPYWGEGYAQLSHIYAAHGDIETACTCAQKSVELEPYNWSLRRHCEALTNILKEKNM